MSRLVFGYPYHLAILILSLQYRRLSKKPGSLELRCFFILDFRSELEWVGASIISLYSVANSARLSQRVEEAYFPCPCQLLPATAASRQEEGRDSRLLFTQISEVLWEVETGC